MELLKKQRLEKRDYVFRDPIEGVMFLICSKGSQPRSEVLKFDFDTALEWFRLSIEMSKAMAGFGL